MSFDIRREIKMKQPVQKKFAEYFFYFILYSFIGWVYEVFLEVVVYRWGFSNRGVLFGPYCIIYGAGALILIFTLGGLKKKEIRIGRLCVTPLLVFVGIVAVTTVLELAGSYIMELLYGEWMWDYTRFPFNFQGRIALNPSLRFGVGGMIFLYVFQPLFIKIVSRWSDRILYTVSGILAFLFLIDASVTLL